MPHAELKTKNLNVLLAITEDKIEKNLLEEIAQIGFGLFTIVHSWKDLIVKVKTKNYDVVIARTDLESIDIITKVLESKFFNKHNIPVIFVLRRNLQNTQMTLLGNIKARFLHEQIISKDLLDYVVKDIYYQNKIDSLRRENELRYKSLFEQSFDINIIIDNELNVIEGNVQFMKKVREKLPYALESLFIYSSTFTKFKEVLLSKKNTRRFKAEILLNKEPSNCLIDSFKLYNEDSELIGSHLIIKDIDNEFRIQQLANRANNLMTTGKFMRSLAHEIRNPLTNLQLALEQLREDLVASENSDLFLNIMKRSSSRITELLNKLMSAYKSSEIELQEEDLIEIVEQSISLANDRISLKEINLKKHYKIHPAPVHVDFEKLSTAILNLIVNAIEAMDKDEKRIDISIDRDKKGQTILTIEDNAMGLSQEQLNNLFTPFYTGKSAGIGLGLTTTQNIILAHDWEIDVESKLGEGSKFTITIP